MFWFAWLFGFCFCLLGWFLLLLSFRKKTEEVVKQFLGMFLKNTSPVTGLRSSYWKKIESLSSYAQSTSCCSSLIFCFFSLKPTTYVKHFCDHLIILEPGLGDFQYDRRIRPQDNKKLKKVKYRRPQHIWMSWQVYIYLLTLGKI